MSGNFIGDTTVALAKNNNYTLSSHEIKIVSGSVINPTDSFEATIMLQGSTVGEYERGLKCDIAKIWSNWIWLLRLHRILHWIPIALLSAIKSVIVFTAEWDIWWDILLI